MVACALNRYFKAKPPPSSLHLHLTKPFAIKTRGMCFRCLVRNHKIFSCHDPLKCFLCLNVGQWASSCRLRARHSRPTQPLKTAQSPTRCPRQAQLKASRPLKSLLPPKSCPSQAQPKLPRRQAAPKLPPSSYLKAFLSAPDTKPDNDSSQAAPP